MKKIARFKKEIFLAVLLALVYFASRLFRLTLIPIFTDEAIYIRWSEIALYDPAWRFISLSDGKQPLFVWLMMITLHFFNDPLFAGRLVSVFAGLGTMVGLFFLGWQLFGKRWTGWLAAGLYLFYPFAFVYDRMALMDGLVGMFCVWALLFEILLVRTLRLDVALILGMIIGGGMLTKTSGFFNLYLLPFSLLLFPWQDKKRIQKLFLWFGLALIVAIESQVMYQIMRLSPLFHMIGQKNTVFVYPFKEWLDHPWRFWYGNLRGLWDWFLGYYRWPLVMLTVFCLLRFKQFFKEKLLLLVWFSAPFFALALFGRVLYPRFIFFMTLSLLPLTALVFSDFYSWLKKPKLFLAGFLALMLVWLRLDYQMVTDPYNSSIPRSDKFQYLNDWPAGGGIKETVAFLNEQSKKSKVYVATEGTFGPLPYALEVFLYKNHKVEIQGFWPLPEKIPRDVLGHAQKEPSFFVFNETQKPPISWPLKFIARYQKGVGNKYLSLYQVVVE